MKSSTHAAFTIKITDFDRRMYKYALLCEWRPVIVEAAYQLEIAQSHRAGGRIHESFQRNLLPIKLSDTRWNVINGCSIITEVEITKCLEFNPLIAIPIFNASIHWQARRVNNPNE